jgi:hypothetical protein
MLDPAKMRHFALPKRPLRLRPAFKQNRMAPETLETTLRLATLVRSVLPDASGLAEALVPKTWEALLSLVTAFHAEVATVLFPHDPEHLLQYARSPQDHLELSLTHIAPVPVGVPCYHCEPSAPGDLVHLFETLDALSRPHPLEAAQLDKTWQTYYDDWYLPRGFHLETACLYLEDHPLPAPYTALPDVIRHALGYTGNWFLDACPHCWNEETEAWYWPEEDGQAAEDVQTLSALWHDARPRWAAICDFYDWLADDALRRRDDLFVQLVAAHHALSATTLTITAL